MSDSVPVPVPVPVPVRAGEAFVRLVEVMGRLRTACPWDREQTLETLRQYLVEEAYEVLSAIDVGTIDGHREELGDLLLQVVFQACIRQQEGAFDVADVADAITEKLIRRHPHVFGDAQIHSAEAQTRNWSELKEKERGRQSALDGVPGAMPALLRALRIGEKAASAGFDWSDASGVLVKLDEERAELAEAVGQNDSAAIEHEVGDLLFTVVNLCRHIGVDPDAALRKTVRRFDARYRAMEAGVHAEGHHVRELDQGDLEARWQRVKAESSS